MEATDLYPIGELARRTGLSVRTIRFYSDEGLVAPTTRSPAGYRLYDLDALVRLELLRTLRELGLDLATSRQVLDRRLSLGEVAAVHADALDAQIQALRLRRTLLRVVARRGSDPEETAIMHRLMQLSDEERRRLIDDFVDGTFGTSGTSGTSSMSGPSGTSGTSGPSGPSGSADRAGSAEAMVRAATPTLPDDPSDEQVAAWVELAALVGDEAFRERMRRTTLRLSAGHPPAVEVEAGEELMAVTRERVADALECGVDPLTDRAAPVVEELVRRFGEAFGRTPDREFREWLARRFEEEQDPEVDRYWRLVWIVNGWQVVPGLVPVHSWLVRALRA
ncbi:MerR family transcriptional regulator [Streptacidiphilus sp. MAP12-33]|uniref:MerR family transcriptional regulator n=1 Tax=Streptacidiphilus sp. MAP12-33 TaxID=3156266 RepID=UPI00351341AC